MSNNRNRCSTPHLVISLLFVALLMLPMVHGLTASHAGNPNAKGKLRGPGFQKEALLEPGYYKTWYRYAENLVTLHNPLTLAKTWIDYRLFAMSDSKGIHVGREGWLFDSRALASYRKDDCDQAEHMTRQIMNIRSAARLAELAGRRFIFSIVPDKSTIYPEYVGPVPQNQACSKSLYDLFLSVHQQQPIEAFVRLDQSLTAAKSSQRLLYDTAGRHWNVDGAKIGTQTLLGALFGDAPFEKGDATADDLSRALMGVPAENAAVIGHETDQDAKKHYSACVLYGGQATTHFLASLIPRFDRVDVIASPRIPSQNHNEDLAAYETIIALIDESELAELSFDMDRFCRMLGADASAGARHTIDLRTIMAKTGSALQIAENRLVIKSMGATAFIEMPRLPGSDSHSLRILKLALRAPQRGELTWAVADDSDQRNIRQLRSGLNQLYLPLPGKPVVRLLINTGQTAGIFQLENAELLSYGDAAALMLPQMETERRSGGGNGTRNDTINSSGKSAVEPDLPPAIVLNDIEAKRIFQRRGAACDIFISGSYRGRPEAIEAAVLQYDSDKIVVPWTRVDATPANGIFMGVLPSVPQGGWYRLAVRFAKAQAVNDQGKSPWGVGLLVACIGQSNMREWFHTGSDLTPSALMSVHRDNKWSNAAATGNGAVAFANHLITRLGIPVGLLDYAVNGSGLCREADWGKGYWADRSPQSIYHRFIQGVTATGGALEYVVWMQGEADAARKTVTGNQYRKTLNNFINRQVRADIVNGSTKDRLPFLVIGMVKRPVGLDEPHQAIRNALVAATRETADCYLAATTLDLDNLGRQHLTAQAYTQLGRRTAQTVLYLLAKADYHRGPHVVQADMRDDITIELRMDHRGGDDFNPARGITGFKAFSGGSAVPIASAHRIAADRIELRLTRPVQRPLRLTYLHGAMPDTQNPVRDNSALQLPLEPFQTLLE
jgi:hypothetical protein